MKIPILSNLLERRSLSKFDEFMDYLVDGGQSIAGNNITSKTALNSTAVFACVRILAETIASLPLPMYKRVQPRGKERAVNHPLYKILHDSPNPYMTSFTFRETLMAHLATWGNAYADINWGANGQVKELWPLRPDRMKDVKYNDRGKLVYIYTLPDGQDTILDGGRVLHIAGLGFDGVVGYSPITMARNAIGLAVATEEFGGTFFRNGAKPGGVLRHPNKLSENAKDGLRKAWEKLHKGLNNSHRVAILEEGMDYTQIGIPPNDAQFLETRKFQLQEIARIYRIPPHMLADLERATFSNIEHQSIDFVVHTVRPWLARWEQAITHKLINDTDKGTYFAEFLVDGLLRGDTATRYQAYSTGRQWGWLSANDVLELENKNPIGEQGDKYLVPMNMISADQVDVFNPKAPGQPKVEEKKDGRSLEQTTIEQRNRAALVRQRVAKSYEGMLKNLGQKIISRETQHVLKATKKHLTERNFDDFDDWLFDFYGEFHGYIKRELRPVIWSIANAISPLASAEVNAEFNEADIDVAVDDLCDRCATRHTLTSKLTIKKLITQAQNEELDAIELIEAKMTHWDENRSDMWAQNGVINTANEIAKLVFVFGGVQYLRWVTMGNKTCPYCQELSNKIIGINQAFLGKDEFLQSEDGFMRINKPTLTPPLHSGCVCTIVPE